MSEMQDANQGTKSSLAALRDVLGLAVLVPIAVYGSGYFLWIGPSALFYGFNVAPYVGVSALIEPGIVYFATLLLAGLIATVVGLESSKALAKYPSRAAILVFEVAFWLAALLLLSAAGYHLATARPVLWAQTPAGNSGYFVFHVVVLAAMLRRGYGLVKSRFFPPSPDRRARSARLRLAQAALLALIAFVQIYLALLFGVLGPNPAKRLLRATVHYSSIRPDLGAEPRMRELYLISRSSIRVLGYDPIADELVDLPSAIVGEIEMHRFSSRQEHLLATLRDTTTIRSESLNELFPIREQLRAIEVAELMRLGLLSRNETGEYTRGGRDYNLGPRHEPKSVR